MVRQAHHERWGQFTTNGGGQFTANEEISSPPTENTGAVKQNTVRPKLVEGWGKMMLLFNQ